MSVTRKHCPETGITLNKNSRPKLVSKIKEINKIISLARIVVNASSKHKQWIGANALFLKDRDEVR